MKKVIFLVLSVFVISMMMQVTSSVYAAGAEKILWGTQIAGSGHMKNAKTDGNMLVLNAPATITAVTGDADDYCIWTAVTPQNRSARSILCGGKGRPNIVGQTLPAGSYRVLPGVNGRSSAKITITLK